MNLKAFHNIYFIGIGGIGMSALASYFYAAQKAVSGYDKTPSDITKILELSGIGVNYIDHVKNITSEFFRCIKNTSCVHACYTTFKFAFNLF